MTHDLVTMLLTELGASISSIEITELHEGTFFAEVEFVAGVHGQAVERKARGLHLVGALLVHVQLLVDQVWRAALRKHTTLGCVISS